VPTPLEAAQSYAQRMIGRSQLYIAASSKRTISSLSFRGGAPLTTCTS